MAETIDQIESHIDWTREQLGADFREIEERVSAATDWREHYQRAPKVFLGAAVVGGVLLASALGRKRARRAPAIEVREPRALGTGRAMNQTSQLVNNITSALIGVGAARLTAYIDGVLPGFDEQYRRVEQRD